ncbi:fumarylacetoacetate hydrolase family protein [Polyangium sorediatum]|uniref:Fumarylacetoacetate hydrolase family protein n=1 Tax=Polyangium sorediatum TaxID=889274 RepID=A0ABT6NRJ9_9BACT|nr:fumarylacetoacetate hydrolase family protein [Polyangium sorediatum]MDI1430956.1 fumarylacetoacetate hydrolase family protein [Polyangium sorediatum]
MRLARVLLPSSPVPRIALERDGCLYDVAELERRREGLLLDEGLSVAEDFFTRVFSVGGAGLDVLDDGLCAGKRPTEARLWPDELLWLPPCLPERALFVQLVGTAEGEEPRYHLGNPRGLLGHQESVAFPPTELRPDVEISIAALLGDELRAATVDEAERAILGFTILLGWVAREQERTSGVLRARDFAATLGPVLVTKDEAGALDDARVRLRVGGVIEELAPPAAPALSFAESLAFVSRHVTLQPGDIVGAPPIEGGSEAARRLGLTFGATLEVAVDRLGKVAARPVRGPVPPPFRRVKS